MMTKENQEIIEKMEEEFLVRESLDFEKSMKIFEGLWKEGMERGVLPPKDPMEGIEVDIKMARVVNSCSEKSSRE
jgi:hypothetical protein